MPRHLLAALTAFLFLTSALPSSAQEIVDEAKSFMAGYGKDVAAGDRGAIAARYHRDGVYYLGEGYKELVPHKDVVSRYASKDWERPHAFEWRDMSYEPAGPDAVVVAGKFAWTEAEGEPPVIYSYTGFLRRQDGSLRIRLEDESRALPASPH